ncbi:MAG TPA: GAF domain-containing protein [Terriglobales bacterium]|nr:GAF domain-containing protein [Terriglobales bacterium]
MSTMQNDALFLANGMRHIVASSDINKTVCDLVRIAAETAGSNMGALYLVDETGRVLKPAVIINLPEDYVRGVGNLAVGEQCCGRAVFHNAPWYVEDIWTNPLFPAVTREGAIRAGIRAGFSVPVVDTEGKCIGSLSAHFPEPHLPSEHEIQRHLLFARLIGFALGKMVSVPGGRNRPSNARSLSEDDGSKRSAAAD